MLSDVLRLTMRNPAYLVTLVALLTATAALVLWLWSRLQHLKRLQAETRMELDGANIRLAQVKNQAALLSNFDPVTGLLVRHVVVERFHLLLTQARRHDFVFGVILVGLTGFDHVSDKLGKEAGDQLLTAVGARLFAATRETDTVGRVREHEFAVLLSELRNAHDMDAVVSKLRAALDPPFTLPGRARGFVLTFHFGSASYPEDGKDWPGVLTAADCSLELSRMQSQSSATRSE